VVVAAAAAASLAAMVLAVRAQRTVSTMKRRYERLSLDDDADGHALLVRLRESLEVERARVSALEEALSTVRGDVEQSLRHVAVVRYDAFGDMGGRMSFSAAIVDDRGDGLIFSSIHARSESRTYAKGVVGGKSDVTLSPEERHALDAARSGRAE